MRTVMLPVDVSVSFVLENHVHVTRAAVVTKNTLFANFTLETKKLSGGWFILNSKLP